MDTNEWLKANLPGPPLALSVALSSEDIAKVSEWLTLVQSAERERCAKLVEPPKNCEPWEVRCGEDGIELMRDLAALIRRA
jgi:hypothetical protein